MKIKHSIFAPTLVIADHAEIAAQLCCRLVKSGTYLSVVEGPRLGRPDRQAELVRRTNAAARAEVKEIFLAGMDNASSEALTNQFSGRAWKVYEIRTSNDIDYLIPQLPTPKQPPLLCRSDCVGVGMLRALRARTGIDFSHNCSPVDHINGKSDHLVVCESGDNLVQVIAANYAFYLRAGLCLIPDMEEKESEYILETFYQLYDQREKSQTRILDDLKLRLREHCGTLPISPNGSITFISRRLPYGFAFSEVPSTHLFTYPDLGIAIINGLSANQQGGRGISVAVLVDPKKADAPEIAEAEKLLSIRGAFLRCYHGRGASVREVGDMIELYPYDLLVIATHCGDVSGHRWTYEFVDSEGLNRTLVVDIATGLARTDDPEMYKVTVLYRFVSLDGVDWNDPAKKESLYVGSAIVDFVELTKTGSAELDLQPVKKENIPRVVGSAALAMHDHNYISTPRSLAAEGTPIIINNACCSWHTLAKSYTYNGARAYIGTLFPVSTSEAHDVAVKLLGKHFGKPLPAALWSSQREVYRDSVRRPYIITGAYPQQFRISPHNVPRYIASRFSGALKEWKKHLERLGAGEERAVAGIKEYITFYERELAGLRMRWREEKEMGQQALKKHKITKRIVDWD